MTSDDSSASIESAVGVLKSFLRDETTKLQFAKNQRAAIIKAARGGSETVESAYRLRAIDAMATRIMHVLTEEAQAYNSKYPWDKMLVDDAKDALSTVVSRLDQQSVKGE